MPGLVPDREGARRSAAVAYIQDKEGQFADQGQQLQAMIEDVRLKTLQAKAFVEASKWVVDSHRSDPQGRPSSSSTVVAGLAQIRSDYEVVEQSIASAREQKATFETITVAYLEKYPAVNVEPLTEELRSFDLQIERMVAVSNEMSSIRS
jgi:hypothetical protein